MPCRGLSTSHVQMSVVRTSLNQQQIMTSPELLVFCIMFNYREARAVFKRWSFACTDLWRLHPLSHHIEDFGIRRQYFQPLHGFNLSNGCFLQKHSIKAEEKSTQFTMESCFCTGVNEPLSQCWLLITKLSTVSIFKKHKRHFKSSWCYA